MPTLTEKIHVGEWLLSTAGGQRSFEEVTVAAPLNTAYPTGTVLGKITASGKYVKSANAAADGSQVAVAILHTPIESGPARDVKATVVIRDAEVWGAKLNDGVALESGVAGELDARGIAVR